MSDTEVKIGMQLPQEIETQTHRKITQREYLDLKSRKKPTEFVPTVDYIDTKNALYGKTIVFTGEISMDREEAMQLAVNRGAKIRNSVSGRTNYLVVGKQDISLVGEDGLSGKEEKAYALNQAGKANIQIIGEAEFFQLVKRND